MEKEVLVLMLLSVFSLMSLALSPTKNYILERQMLDACGIQAIANISRMQWQSSKDHVLRGYDFAYDGSFDFKDGANADVEYFYDANGALVKDLNKGISNIEYDILGNLKCITFSNGFKTRYIYDAAGNKLRTTHESAVTNTTDYIGNFVFEDGKLDRYLFDGGYCSFDNNQNPTFLYYEKDHLGSVRMVVNEKGTIEQVNHYYPFGGVYGDLSYNAEIQKSKYIGKEFDHMYGLDWYDHGARMYDAAGLFWDRKDPLFSKYYSLSPYFNSSLKIQYIAKQPCAASTRDL